MRLGATIAAANTNLEKSFTKVNITDGYAGGGGNEQNDYSILLHMPKYIPWVYNINGVDQYVSPPLGPHRLGNVSGNNSLSNWNYYALLNNGSKQSDENFNYNANFSLNYEIPFIKGLAVKFNYGLTQSSSKTEQVMMPMSLVRNGQGNKLNNHLFTDNTAWDAPVLNRSGSRVSYDNLTTKNQQTNFFITYDRKFGDHNIAAMGSVEKVINGSEKERNCGRTRHREYTMVHLLVR